MSSLLPSVPESPRTVVGTGRANALAAAAWWLPVAALVTLLVVAQSGLPSPLSSGTSGGAPAPAAPVRLAHFVMLSGVGCLAAWFLALDHRRRCLGGPGPGGTHEAGAPLAAAGILAVWFVALAGRLDLSDETLALGLFVYLPTLGITFGFAARALRQLRTFWPGATVLAGLVALNFLCQLPSLDAQGRPRNELVFVLPSVPITAGVVVWLTAYARSNPGSPPRPRS